MKKFIHPLLLSLCAYLPNACVSDEDPHTDSEIEAVSNSETPEVAPGEIDASVDNEVADLSNESVPEIGSEKDEINQILADGMPAELNVKVEEWINYFTKRNPDSFQRFMDRGEPYKKMIVATLREYGLPSEIYYLALIESGFMLHAKSPMAAMGFWQFMPATGKRYGLRVDRYVDERRDPWRSSVAASMYLSDLNNVFDSWYLAMAAYNAGETRIMNAIMRGKSRDFMSLVKGRVLPSETMDYIPKFLAAFIIGTNPEKYGFRRPSVPAHEPVSLVAVPSPISLGKVAEITGVPLESLQQFNPHLKTGITPPGTPSYKIWVPQHHKAQFANVQDALAAQRLTISEKHARTAAREIANADTSRPKFHRVRRGDNLATIADQYNITVKELMEANRLKNTRIFVGRKLKIQTQPGSLEVVAAAKKPDRREASIASLKNGALSSRKAAALAALKVNQPSSNAENDADTYYRVKRGDNLHDLAVRFHVSINELKKMNNLRRNDLKIGQLLLVAKNES